ncbi:Phytochrome E [Hibiscus syriacus]|uniref:Phytochrome E n=1 Tax=Hibiscus syriacus TaxID=106335 RepID=A0A6A2YF19_HIBSY|nr:Phytochrome E [Hibiscus syriacus]
MESESGERTRHPKQQKPNTTLSSSTASNLKPMDKDKVIAQYIADSVPDEQMTAYLSRIQRGGLVQTFGCLIAVEEPNFRIIGYSENCFELLGLSFDGDQDRFIGLKGLIGIDAKSLFMPASGASLAKVAASREISLLNPIWVYSRITQKPFYATLHRIDVGIVIDLEPARLGSHALSLVGVVQSQKLVVQAIARVMVYKFHDDGHGEVVSEIRRSDLESYLGLHYPATDIPQVARFLFKQNRVGIIYDCHAKPAKVVQSDELKQDLCLVNSTLRSPHGCHMQYMENMGSIASLAMVFVINGNDSTKLWGLVVCHHSFPRYVPFPLRYACEFLMHAFGLQLYMELQLASQLTKKKILKTQTLLCDMLLRNAPFGIVTQSPNIMDLINCDGDALFYRGKCWLLGVTPTESQFADGGYPVATLLGDAACGVATARITSKDFLFWFKSHTVKEVKWGGAKHHSEDRDGSGRMYPRLSFNAFLEVVKSRSLPWEIPEMNVIHSLQLIMRDSIQDMEEYGSKVLVYDQQNGTEMHGINELSSVAYEMVRLIETGTTPVFGVDAAGLINGWNAKLTSFQADDAIGKSRVVEVVHEDSRDVFEDLLGRVLQDENACCSEWNAAMEKRTGCSRTEVIVLGMQQASEEYKQENNDLFKKLKHVVYVQEMKNPLNGIKFTHKLLETTAISEKQKQFLETSDACERQILAIIEDTELGSIDEGQVMIMLKERNLQLLHETPKEIKTLSLYGDRIRLQLVISNFLHNVVHYAPPNGWAELKISPGLKLIRDGNEFVRLQFRMTHPGKGLPSSLVEEMFKDENGGMRQGRTRAKHVAEASEQDEQTGSVRPGT